MPQPLTSEPTKAPAAPEPSKVIVPNALRAKLRSKLLNTNDIQSSWFHLIFYGETDARKTTTAARFGTPEEVRIVMVRRKEQLIPLQGLGYTCFLAESADELSRVIAKPELAFDDPTWLTNPNRTLVIDDITETKDLFMEANETRVDSFGQVKEVRDTRQIVKGAKDDLRTIIKAALAAPQHLIVTALSRTIEDAAQNKIEVTVDLSNSVRDLLTTEFEYVFYSLKSSATLPQWQCLTTSEMRTIKRMNERGQEVDYQRTVFAKSKMALNRTRALQPRVAADLRAIWQVVKESASAA